MSWNRLLANVMAVLKPGRSPEEMHCHESSMRDVLERMAASGVERNQPVRSTLALVGDRWTTLIFEVLAAGPMRHSELRDVIRLICEGNDISQRILTLKLRQLERDGLLVRTSISGPVRRVEYALTQRGRELHELIDPITRWAVRHHDSINAARASFDAQLGSVLNNRER